MSQTKMPPPLRMSITDLQNIMNMAEASIKSAEFANHLFGLEQQDLVQARAIASDMQSRCQLEIMRQEMIAEQTQRAENEKAAAKKAQEAEEARIRKEQEEVKTKEVKTDSEAKNVPEADKPAA